MILRDISDKVQYGYTASAKEEEIGPQFLRITDIVPENLQWKSVPYCEIDEKKLDKYSLKDGDIVIARTGATTGYAKYIKNPPSAVFASYLVRLKIQSGVNKRFIGFIVESDEYKRFIHANIGGVAQPNANAQVLTSFPVNLPSFTAQNKIASILSAYDDLIENNLKRIKILEEMAQMIYREWFVNFRFPNHESVKMVDSPLGKIPEGWEIGRLDDAIVLQRGFDLPKKKRKGGNIPIYASTGVVDMHNEAKVKGPGVVTGRSGSLGMVTYIDDDFWPLNTTLWIKRFKRLTPLAAYFHLSSMGLEQYNTGAAVPTLNRNNIHGFQTILPSEEVLAHFDVTVLPMFEHIKTLRLKNDNLRKTRNLLLPKLISGELDVEKLDIRVAEENGNA